MLHYSRGTGREREKKVFYNASTSDSSSRGKESAEGKKRETAHVHMHRVR